MPGSVGSDRELLDHRVRQQLSGQLGHPGHDALVGGFTEFQLKSLALPDGENLAKSESAARAGDCLALRIVDFRLQHYVDDDSGHTRQRNATVPGPPLSTTAKGRDAQPPPNAMSPESLRTTNDASPESLRTTNDISPESSPRRTATNDMAGRLLLL
jgi:hypothetical protein